MCVGYHPLLKIVEYKYKSYIGTSVPAIYSVWTFNIELCFWNRSLNCMEFFWWNFILYLQFVIIINYILHGKKFDSTWKLFMGLKYLKSIICTNIWFNMEIYCIPIMDIWIDVNKIDGVKNSKCQINKWNIYHIECASLWV